MYKKCFRLTHNLLSGIYVSHWLFTTYQNPILAESMRITRQKPPSTPWPMRETTTLHQQSIRGQLNAEADLILATNYWVLSYTPCPLPYTASIVEGGFGAMLYVTLTMPGTSRIISLASFSSISNER